MSFSTYFPWACWSISHLMTLVRLPVSEKSCDFISSVCSIIPPFHHMDVYLWTCQTGTLSRCSLKCIISVTQLLLQKQTFLTVFFQWHWSSFCIFSKEKKINKKALHRNFKLSGKSGDQSKHIKILFSFTSVCWRWPPLILNIFLYL